MMNQTIQEHTGYPSIDKPWLKYYTEEAIKSMPFQGSVYEHVFVKNQDYLENIALQYFGKKITYKELFQKTEIAAAALSEAGVHKGDNVILLMSSCPELVYLLLALNKLGAVANMINPLFSGEQIKKRINDTNAGLLIVWDQLYDMVKDIKSSLCIKKTVVIPAAESMPVFTGLIAGIKLKKKIPYGKDVIPWKAFIVHIGETKVEAINDEELPAIMVCSSGSTGTSKSIVLINKGINATIAHYEFAGFEYDRSDSYLQMVPVWFGTGLIFSLLMPLALGMKVVLEPVFSAENFISDIVKYKPNMITIPTAIWIKACGEFDKKGCDLSFVKYPITGGEAVSGNFEEQINCSLSERGCEAKLLKGYGMCELGSTVTATSKSGNKHGATGYPIKGVTVAAFNIETNEECRYNERGEIRVLSPARMKEYFKQPSATAEFFWKDSRGQEWGRTGDVGYVDEDGFVFVEGRANDCFTTKNGKCYCFDIENIILQDEGIEQCEVVGARSESGYDKPVAFVVAKSEEVSVDRLYELCKRNLTEDKVPVKINVIDRIPVKPSGKRDMEKLKEMAAEMRCEG